MMEACRLYIRHVTFGWVTSDINTWSSHVRYEWVISYIIESCQLWVSHVTFDWITSNTTAQSSHVTYEWDVSHRDKSRMNVWMNEWVMSHMIESCFRWMSHVTFDWVTSDINVPSSHVRYEWVMSHMNETCHIETSRVWMYGWMNESCDIWWSHVISHCVMSRLNDLVRHEWVVSEMNESRDTWMRHVTYEWVTSHIHRKSSQYLPWSFSQLSI